MKRLFAVVTTGAVALSLVACSSGTTTAKAGADSIPNCNVGISMPTRSLERWINDGAQLQKELKAAGCTVDLQYANNATDQQISQIQNQIAGGSKILVVAAVDGSVLAPVLAEAKKQKATVIAYDRLILNTKDVDYYATFDNYKVGQLQGEYIVSKLGLAEGKGPFNLEPFAGSPDDNNAKLFFAGAWDVLTKYVKNGQLVVPSGKAPSSDADWATIGIQAWASDKAQSEMDNRLSSFYTGSEKVNVVLSPNDSLAIGIEASLKSAGYTPGANYPIITGQDADTANVKAILAGEQSMTVWKDTRTLGEQTFKMIKAIATNKKVVVNDTKTYDNGKKVVPSYLLTPVVVTKDDVQKVLIGSGFTKASDVGL
jgi:putative multiple sugar transport system substrate-binding protein